MVCFEIINALFSDRFLQNFRLTATKFFSNLHQPRVIKQSLEIFIDFLILVFQLWVYRYLHKRRASVLHCNVKVAFHKSPCLIFLQILSLCIIQRETKSHSKINVFLRAHYTGHRTVNCQFTVSICHFITKIEGYNIVQVGSTTVFFCSTETPSKSS